MSEYKTRSKIHARDLPNFLQEMAAQLLGDFGPMDASRTFRGTVQFRWTAMRDNLFFSFKHPHPVEIQLIPGNDQKKALIQIVSVVRLPRGNGGWASRLVVLAPVNSDSELVVQNDPTVQQMLDMLGEHGVTNQNINLWGGQHSDEHGLILHQNESKITLRPTVFDKQHDAIPISVDHVLSALVAEWFLANDLWWPEMQDVRYRLHSGIRDMILWRMENDPRWRKPLPKS